MRGAGSWAPGLGCNRPLSQPAPSPPGGWVPAEPTSWTRCPVVGLGAVLGSPEVLPRSPPGGWAEPATQGWPRPQHRQTLRGHQEPGCPSRSAHKSSLNHPARWQGCASWPQDTLATPTPGGPPTHSWGHSESPDRERMAAATLGFPRAGWMGTVPGPHPHANSPAFYPGLAGKWGSDSDL